MADGDFSLPLRLQNDLRFLLHDVRGSIGIVSSTLELLLQEDMHPIAERYLRIVQRQMYRVLMESELFGATLNFRPEIFLPESCPALPVLTEVQDLIGTNLEVVMPENGPMPVVHASPYLLKLVFLAILIPPSGLDPALPLLFGKEGRFWMLFFPWNQAPGLLPKFEWSREVLRSFEADLELRDSRLVLSLPACVD